MIVITMATTPSVNALRRVGVMQDPPWGNMTPPGSGSSLAGEHERGSACQAGEGAEVAPADRFLERHRGKDREHREGSDFLRDLELAAGGAVSVADPVRGHGEAIFDQCDPVGGEIGIIRAAAAERGQRSLEEGDGDRRTHVDAGVEQFGGKVRATLCDLAEALPQPAQSKVDVDRLASRQLAHRPRVALRPGHLLGDPETGRPALVGGLSTNPPSRSINASTKHPHPPHYPYRPPSSRGKNQIGDV